MISTYGVKQLPKSYLFKLVNLHLIDHIFTFFFMVYNLNIFFYFCLTIFSLKCQSKSEAQTTY